MPSAALLVLTWCYSLYFLYSSHIRKILLQKRGILYAELLTTASCPSSLNERSTTSLLFQALQMNKPLGLAFDVDVQLKWQQRSRIHRRKYMSEKEMQILSCLVIKFNKVKYIEQKGFSKIKFKPFSEVLFMNNNYYLLKSEVFPTQ